MMNRRVCVFMLVLLWCAATAWSQDLGDELLPQESAAGDQTDPWTMGVLFSADNILLDIGTFGSGVGIIARRPNSAIRGSVSGFFTNSADMRTMELGGAWVSYTRNERISPYWVIAGSAGFLSLRTEIDDQNWTESVDLYGSVGGGFGAEFFLLDFLSVFAEYQLSVDLSREVTTETVAGQSTESDPDWSYTIQTEVGNSSRLGIAVYFKPVVSLPERD